MKAAVVFLCFAVSAFAQQKVRLGQTPPGLRFAAACGPQTTNFKVKLDDSQHGPLIPQSGMAQVYFINDAGIRFGPPAGGVKYGVDGSWAGAGHGDSWFAFSVAPGEHHLCATLQSSFAAQVAQVAQRVELAHFAAEAGKSYYFRTRLVLSDSVELLEFVPIDSDQGEYLVSTFPMATAKPKK
ncbi:MAG: hypothetical protein ABSB50_06440 [Terracidiphilus sp.]|jgi:hypothetical protein